MQSTPLNIQATIDWVGSKEFEVKISSFTVFENQIEIRLELCDLNKTESSNPESRDNLAEPGEQANSPNPDEEGEFVLASSN